jgi:hypothetical protein
MPPQIVRLVLLTVGILGTYFTGRYFLTPPSFYQYGFYRGAAIEELAARRPEFAGKAACDKNCHGKTIEMLAKGEHKTVSCEACHGICREHVEDRQVEVKAAAPDGAREVRHVRCTRCHEADPARSTWIKQIESKKHYSGQRCTECHLPHQPNEVPDDPPKKAS